MRVLEVICEGGLSLSGTQLIDNANHVPPASRLLIRDATVDDTAILARVHIDSWRTTYHGILPDDVLDGLSYESHVPEWVSIISDRKPNEFVTVAEWDGAVVGFANGGPERFDDPSFQGELYAIYILAEFRGRGIGKDLFSNAGQLLLANEMSKMKVWVLERNPYRRFYEKMNGELVGRKSIEIGGKSYDEVAYGWSLNT